MTNFEQPTQQEPVGQLMEEAYGRGQVLWFNKPHDLSMLYTHPLASKLWVMLTEDEIENIWEGSTAPILRKEYINLARAIEAKLKEKNT